MLVKGDDVPVGARARGGPGASIRSDGGGGRVGDDAVLHLDAVDEPVAGNTFRDVGANDVDINHGNCVGSAEGDARVGWRYADSGGGADL